MLISKIAAGVIIVCIIIIAYQYHQSDKQKIQRAGQMGKKLGNQISSTVVDYLSKRMQSFEKHFLPVYLDQLAAIEINSAAGSPKEIAGDEFALFLNELNRAASQLPEEIQVDLAEQFEMARLVGVEAELLKLVDSTIAKHLEDITEKALEAAEVTLLKFKQDIPHETNEPH